MTTAMTTVELTAAFWTLAGDMQLLRGPPCSPHAFEARVAAAARAGYCGFGLWTTDIEAIRMRLSFREMKAILDAHGMVHVEIEGLLPWYSRHDHRAAYESAAKTMFAAAEQLAARHVKVGGPLLPNLLPQLAGSKQYSTAELTESFAALCTDLDGHGTSAVFEFVVLSYARLQDIAQIVVDAGARNSGLSLDAWHITKAGIDYAELAAMPRGLIRHVELADGLQGGNLPLIEDCLNGRRLCGAGNFDIPAFIAAVRSAGYDGPYGVEIVSDELRRMPLAEVADSAYRTTLRQFRQ